jgi:hypothetical protein
LPLKCPVGSYALRSMGAFFRCLDKSGPGWDGVWVELKTT